MYQSLSLLVLLLITIIVYIFSKKMNLPYTIMLVVTGLLLTPIIQIPFFSFIGSFRLSPNILFYVFLPILLFESAYNINYRDLLKDRKSISILSIISLLISSTLIALLLQYILPLIGIKIDFMMGLLFGTLISATDPVAVLALFKSLGAPKRLTLIFEGESLFNDGTALALFLVVLWILKEGWSITYTTFLGWFWSFLSMAIGGAIFGTIVGVIFSKIIEYIKNNETIEIMLTMIVAHLTFLLAELISHNITIGWFHLSLSWVIATTFAAIIMGNYGRYKVSPKVEEYMEKFRWFFAFLSNSLVFILLGLMLNTITIPFHELRTPILIAIWVVVISRAVSVYIPISILNIIDKKTHIPLSRQHLLAWGSLRWALAFMMILMIPDTIIIPIDWYTYSLKDFLMVITMWCILFTLFLKAPTIIPIMKYMNINKLQHTEEVGYMEAAILINLQSIDKLKNALDKWYITDNEYDVLSTKYEHQLKQSVQDMTHYCNNKKEVIENIIKKNLTLYALGIEKQYLKELFRYNEVDEKSFNTILYTIRRQIERVEHDLPQIKSLEERINLDIYQRIGAFFDKNRGSISEYIKYRAKAIITRKVVKEMKYLQSINLWFDKNIFNSIITLYQDFQTIALNKKQEILNKEETNITNIESKLMEKSIFKSAEKLIKELYKKNMISYITYAQLEENININIDNDIR